MRDVVPHEEPLVMLHQVILLRVALLATVTAGVVLLLLLWPVRHLLRVQAPAVVFGVLLRDALCRSALRLGVSGGRLLLRVAGVATRVTTRLAVLRLVLSVVSPRGQACIALLLTLLIEKTAD